MEVSCFKTANKNNNNDNSNRNFNKYFKWRHIDQTSFLPNNDFNSMSEIKV